MLLPLLLPAVHWLRLENEYSLGLNMHSTGEPPPSRLMILACARLAPSIFYFLSRESLLAEAPPFRRQPPFENRVYLLRQQVQIRLWSGCLPDMRWGRLSN